VTALQTPADDAPAEEWGELAVRIPGWQCRPDAPVIGSIAWTVYRVDPDHWAWEGWMLTLLGDTLVHISTGFGDGHVVCIIVDGDTVKGTGRTIGRACIAAVASIGRWPGGEE
tara:strand:+ start:745 stop:1083 length:339 start_codon:yes stop_codon:yes gene_type:complete